MCMYSIVAATFNQIVKSDICRQHTHNTPTTSETPRQPPFTGRELQSFCLL